MSASTQTSWTTTTHTIFGAVACWDGSAASIPARNTQARHAAFQISNSDLAEIS